MRGFALLRWLIAAAIMILLVFLGQQVYSASQVPLRSIQIGSDILITCKSAESIKFTGFSLFSEDGEQPRPFMCGYLGPTKGTATLNDDPPTGAPLRLRFAINTNADIMDVEGLSVAANEWLGVVGPLPGDAQEIPLDDDVLEYIHAAGKLELHVRVVAGRLVIEYRRPG